MSASRLNRIQSIIISQDTSIIDSLKKMDVEHSKLLFVFQNSHFLSILTIGDIQRSIIKNIKLETPVSAIIDKNKIYAYEGDTKDSIKKLMLRERAQFMPVLDTKGDIVDVYLWDDLFPEAQSVDRKPINIPVVIMAGGKGTRLKPLTNVIPKPLIPIGEKTILEVILNQFESIGCKHFYMSVNYKKEMIRFYMNNLSHQYDIVFFEEDMPLGTIGSVSLLKGKITTPFFVSNCDSITDQDYRDVYDYHISNNNALTIVTMVKSIKIPYGVINTGEDGLMIGLKEKPEQTFMVNTGVYILNPECISEIPEGQFFHVTDLMEKIKLNGGRVGCFPVSEQSWVDIGEWPEYLKMINVL